jgi:hypothetical protein
MWSLEKIILTGDHLQRSGTNHGSDYEIRLGIDGRVPISVRHDTTAAGQVNLVFNIIYIMRRHGVEAV